MSDNPPSKEDIKNIGAKLNEIEKYIDEFFSEKQKIRITPDLRVIDKIFAEDFKNGKPPRIKRKTVLFKIPVGKTPPSTKKTGAKIQKEVKTRKTEKKVAQTEKTLFKNLFRREKETLPKKKEKIMKKKKTSAEKTPFEKENVVEFVAEETESEFRKVSKKESPAKKTEKKIMPPAAKASSIEIISSAEKEKIDTEGTEPVPENLNPHMEGHLPLESKEGISKETDETIISHPAGKEEKGEQKGQTAQPEQKSSVKEVSDEDSLQRIPLKIEFGGSSEEMGKPVEKKGKETDEKKIIKAFRKSKSKSKEILKKGAEGAKKTVKPLVDLSMKNLIGELLREEKEEEKKDLVDISDSTKKDDTIPSKEELVEHVLFDEDDPFYFNNGTSPLPLETEEGFSKFADDVELPREALRFQPYVEFKSAEENEEINIPVDSDEFEEIDFYPLYRPFAYVKILREKRSLDKIYAVLEPELSEEEKEILDFLNDTLSATARLEIEKLEEISAEKYLEEELNQIIDDYKIKMDDETKQKIMYLMKRDLVGYGRIDALMRDPNIEDISCDGANIPVFVYHRKHGSLRTNINFKDESELSSFVIRLAQKCGKHISIAEPMLDATMPDGSRIQMTLSTEITTKGSTFTIRKFRAIPYSPIDLVKMNTLSPEMLAYLWILVENGASGIFAGGTASGKTTTLNAVSLFIPREAKIVSIEETREINLPHPNWIPGVTRVGFGEVVADKVVGEIDMYDLMKAALRQRPEYIIVGEIRGREAYVLFQAMATGHTTYSTMHADSPQSLVHRLEGKPINIPRIMLQSLDFICFHTTTRVKDKRQRRLVKIVEMIDIDPRTKELITNEVFSWDSINDSFKYSGRSYLLEEIRVETNMSKYEIQQELNNRIKIINWMIKNEKTSLRDVVQVLNEYRDNPEELLKRVESNA